MLRQLVNYINHPQINGRYPTRPLPLFLFPQQTMKDNKTAPESMKSSQVTQPRPKIPINIDELRRLKQAKKEAKRKLNATANLNNKPLNLSLKVMERAFTSVPHQTSLKTVSGGIRVMTFNILAQSLIKRELFPNSGDVLKWKTRRRMIIDEIKMYNPDVISLQELDNFEPYYQAVFNDMGYNVKYDCHPSKRHGCGIAYKKTKFVEMDYELIDYNTDPTCPPSYLTGNIAQILALKTTANNSVGFVVGNTHLYWRPTSNYERFRQTLIYLKRFLAFKSNLNRIHQGDSKWVSLLLGDFNTTPDDPAYGILTTNKLTKEQIEDLNVSRTYRKPEEKEEEDENDSALSIPVDTVDQLLEKYNHLQQWKSIYSCYGTVNPNKEEQGLFGEPKITNYTIYFKGILDYMFIEKDEALCIKQILMPPKENDLKPSLPNKNFGSDHLCLVADIEY
ncbi:MAG: Endonuclease/exonuclease/phosphatase [Benjaminiella poitrasii]|nr:MAG: Endonuclease/exonuclease/phosphatase [Benjaminiella poitrasii]